MVLLENVISGDIKSASFGDSNGGKDFYKFNLATPSEISIYIDSDISQDNTFNLKVLDNNGSAKLQKGINESGNLSGKPQQAGEYYFELGNFSEDATYEFLFEIV